MKRIVFISAFLIISLSMFSQPYKSAIGIRGGVSQGITFKHFLGSNSAFDLIAGTYRQGIHIVGLYEIHSHNFAGVNNLSLFYGPGGHFASFSSTNFPSRWHEKYDENTIAIGVDFVFGIEYTFDEVPINIGIDIKPAFNIIPTMHFWQGGALFLRYTL